MSVVLVGKGDWSKKLEVMIKSSTNLDVRIIGARAFLEKEVNGDIYWLATTPTNQLQILPRLPVQSKVILEKPAFLNLAELNIICQEYIRRQNTLFFSLPWNFSSCLEEISKVLRDEDIVSIEIHRGGPVLRSYMPSYLDWIPHDLGLLSALDQHLIPNFETIELKGESVYVTGSLSRRRISIKSGYAKERQAFWRMTALNGQVFDVDFYSQVQQTGEEPLKRMFSRFLAGPYDSSKMFGVWREFFRHFHLP
jgi:hypothetical protein